MLFYFQSSFHGYCIHLVNVINYGLSQSDHIKRLPLWCILFSEFSSTSSRWTAPTSSSDVWRFGQSSLRILPVCYRIIHFPSFSLKHGLYRGYFDIYKNWFILFHSSSSTFARQGPSFSTLPPHIPVRCLQLRLLFEIPLNALRITILAVPNIFTFLTKQPIFFQLPLHPRSISLKATSWSSTRILLVLWFKPLSDNFHQKVS